MATLNKVQADIETVRESINRHWQELDRLLVGAPERHEARTAIDDLVTELSKLLQQREEEHPPRM